MVAFDSSAGGDHLHSGGVDLVSDVAKSEGSSGNGTGSSIRDSDISAGLDQISVEGETKSTSTSRETDDDSFAPLGDVSSDDSSSGKKESKVSGESKDDGKEQFDGEHDAGKHLGEENSAEAQGKKDDEVKVNGEGGTEGEDGEKSDASAGVENNSDQDVGESGGAEGGDDDNLAEGGADVSGQNENQDVGESGGAEGGDDDNLAEGGADVSGQDEPSVQSADGSSSEDEDVQGIDQPVADGSDSGGSSNVNTQSVDPTTLADVKSVDPNSVEQLQDLQGFLGANGDVLDGGGGVNTVVGAGGNDIIAGNGNDAFNTVSTGTGNDLVILGTDATNRIFDFDPTLDKFGLTGDIPFEQISFGQGTNPNNGGLNQPLDSRNNAVVFNTLDNNILASLTFTSAGDLSDTNFVSIDPDELAALTSSSSTGSSDTSA